MRRKLVVIHTGISRITIITLNHQSVHYESCTCISYSLRKNTKKQKNKNNSKEEKSHLPLCSDTQMMMNNVKDLHTEKAIAIPSLMRWCVRVEQQRSISKHTPGGAGEQQQVLCVHAPARTSAYIQ